ncbi:MAG: NAD(P)-dependent oxidoreductase [Anaerolineae bacterium]
MKILLAGASGAIGRLLLPLLIRAGHEVTGTTRSAAKADLIAAQGGHPLLLDVLDREATFAALERTRPDLVLHQLTDLAARDFAGNSRLRIEGTRNLVDAAKAVGVQRMIVQSIAWIYAPGDAPATEDEPFDMPRNNSIPAVYTMEQAAAEMPISVVLRYGFLYGPGTWYSREGLTTESILKGEVSATDAIASFLHVADAAYAAIAAINWPSGAYNIVDDDPASGREWVPYYASLIGAPSPTVQPGRAAWERGASNAKARQIGWIPLFPNWRDGFKAELSSETD